MTATIEVYANNARTELSSGIISSSTTIQVVDASKFPQITTSTNKFFRLIITSATSPNEVQEICYVTNVSGNILTVLRGQDGTTAASWSTGAPCWNASTKGGFNSYSTKSCAAATGTNAYAVVLNDNASAYYQGMTVLFTVANSNTSSSVSLNVNALGAKSITNNDGSVILIGQLTVGSVIQCVYNTAGTGRWELQSLNAVGPTTVPASTDSTNKLATTAFVQNAISARGTPSNTTPLMDGTETAGTETNWARGNHRHPTDTSRAALASPTFTGEPKAPTPTSGDNSTKIATTAFVKAAVSSATLPSGTKMLFYAATAPTGWTAVTGLNNIALRIVSASTTGGTVTTGSPFTTIFANNRTTSGTVGNTILTVAQMPVHSHGITDPGHDHKYGNQYFTPSAFNDDNSFVYGQNSEFTVTSKSTTGITINNAGGTGGVTQGHNHTFSGGNLDMKVTYADFIVCQKN